MLSPRPRSRAARRRAARLDLPGKGGLPEILSRLSTRSESRSGPSLPRALHLAVRAQPARFDRAGHRIQRGELQIVGAIHNQKRVPGGLVSGRILAGRSCTDTQRISPWPAYWNTGQPTWLPRSRATRTNRCARRVIRGRRCAESCRRRADRWPCGEGPHGWRHPGSLSAHIVARLN